MNLYFTNESWDTLLSITLFITVKAITKLNLGHRNKFEIEFQKTSRRSSRSPDNAEWSFHVVVFQRTTKKCTKSYNARAQPLFCSLNLLFSDVAVAGVVFFDRLPVSIEHTDSAVFVVLTFREGMNFIRFR